MALSLAWETCVRTRSEAAACRACVDACPAAAVSLEGGIEVELSRCTGCGLCQAECPSDSFSGAFDAAAFVASAPAVVRCGEGGLPCVGALSAEDLATLAMKAGALTVEARPCASAAPGHALAERHAGEAQRWLAIIGAKASVTFVAGPPVERAAPAAAAAVPSQGRRQLLRLLVPMRASRLVRGELDAGLLRRPPQTARRRRLLAAFGSGYEPPAAAVSAAGLAFTSSKALDEARCTGCEACVSVCPTLALTVTHRSRELRFDASRCVGCSACHEVCEPGALQRAETFPPADFFEVAPRTLGRCERKEQGDEPERSAGA